MPPRIQLFRPAAAPIPERALILRGDGSTLELTDEFRGMYPEHVLWTLNATYLPGAAMHWDIHYHQSDPQVHGARRAAIEAGARVALSPFVRARHDLEFAYPLDAVWRELGLALFQRTLCWQIAYALLGRAQGWLRFDVLCLPGHDYNRFPHFAFRDGPGAWLALALGAGVSVALPAESALLRRRTDLAARNAARFARHDEPHPHAYGQPLSITAPLAPRYGWA